MQNKRVGIYINAFDPIHEGHLNFASQAIRTSKLDKLYFLIEPRPKYKQGVKAFSHRVNMATLATRDNDSFGVVVVKHARYGVDETVNSLKQRFLNEPPV